MEMTFAIIKPDAVRARVFRDLTVFENLRMGGYTLSNVLGARCKDAMDLFPRSSGE